MNNQLKAIKCELARRSFWKFEQATFPEFFKEDRPHLKLLADTLQSLYEGKLLNKNGEVVKRLMINMPPRHAKSFSLVNFCQWVLGKDQTNRVITVSYNETLSSRFSKGVRNAIETENLERSKIAFQDVFPRVKIKHGDSAASLWSLEGQYFNYLGASFGGTITGIGCNIGIIDDPIKNDKEAFNDRVLQEHWNFYVDTFLSRLEKGAIQIVNMTRWATKDLCGRLLDQEADKWHVLNLEAFNGKEMLCNDLLTYDDYLDKKNKTSPAIFNANYHQKPVDEEGLMYKYFKQYTELPENGIVKAYIDTADEGKDYLCCIVYMEYEKKAYLLDVVYTRDPMEITEGLTAECLTRNGCTLVKVESNNGGKGFARNIERLMRERGNYSTVVQWFHQTQNKKARIYSNSYFVQENIFFPEGWQQKFRDFYSSLSTYKKEGKNEHDDSADALTGVAEQINVNEFIFR